MREGQSTGTNQTQRDAAKRMENDLALGDGLYNPIRRVPLDC